MLLIEVSDAVGHATQVYADDEVLIGKGPKNKIRLDNWRVGKTHARIFKTPGGVQIEDLGAFGGTLVNGQPVMAQYGPLKETDKITIGPFTLVVKPVHQPEGMATRPKRAAPPVPPVAAEIKEPESFAESSASLLAEFVPPVILPAPTVAPASSPSLESPQPIKPKHKSAAVAAPIVPVAAPRPAPIHPQRQQLSFEWRKRIHLRLLEVMNLRRHDVSRMSDEALRADVWRLTMQVIDEIGDDLPPQLNAELICRQVVDEAIGLGPLEELLDDPTISEIMVNRFDEIFVEREGRIEAHPLVFTGDQAVMGVIERIVAPLGRRIDESSPMVDARLKDGSRVNAIIPPLALKGPCLTIRKFSQHKLTIDSLVSFGALNQDMANFLNLCVNARKNIIVSGGTGSGKTTLLNILSNFIPMGERIITIEDAAELQLHHSHQVNLEARPSNAEGKGLISIRDLVRNSLRMRPDRIVVGECRGPETLDMLQAMNTGHEGSLTTLHANTPRDALARMETMILMSGFDLPISAIREQITSAVDLVVQQTRYACGTRLISSIVEITGIDNGKIQMQEIFRYVPTGHVMKNGVRRIQGEFRAGGIIPSFFDDLLSFNPGLNVNMFHGGAPNLNLAN